MRNTWEMKRTERESEGAREKSENGKDYFSTRKAIVLSIENVIYGKNKLPCKGSMKTDEAKQKPPRRTKRMWTKTAAEDEKREKERNEEEKKHE